MPPRPLGGGAAVRPLICLLFFFGPHLVSAAYTCTSVGTECLNRDYSSGSYATEAAVRNACDADASCKAYDWSETGGLGFKCSTTVTREDHYDEYVFCSKPSKNRTQTPITHARTHIRTHKRTSSVRRRIGNVRVGRPTRAHAYTCRKTHTRAYRKPNFSRCVRRPSAVATSLAAAAVAAAQSAAAKPASLAAAAAVAAAALAAFAAAAGAAAQPTATK